MKDPTIKALNTYPPGDVDNLIPILQHVQSLEGYVSPEAIGKISSSFKDIQEQDLWCCIILFPVSISSSRASFNQDLSGYCMPCSGW